MTRITHIIHLGDGTFLPGFGTPPSDQSGIRYTFVKEVSESEIASIPLAKVVGKLGNTWLIKVDHKNEV